MLLRPGSGQFINRADPRWRGHIQWFPFFTGTRGNFGALGDAFANATGSGFIADPLVGSAFNVPASTSSGTALTVNQLQLNGAGTRWTFAFQYRHRLQSNSFVPLIAMGDPAGTNYLEFLLFDGANFFGDLYVTTWTANCLTSPIPSGGGGGDRIVRVACTYDGTTVTLRWRAFDTGTGAWTSGSNSAAIAFTITNNHPLTINGRPGGGTGGQQATLAFLAILAGACWSAEEANAFLIDPTPLWTPQPFVWVPTSAGGTSDGVGSSAGVATASGVGASTAASAASSAGVATATAVGASQAAAAGSSAGVATVSGVGGSASSGSAAGASAGVATVAGVGASLAAAAGSAAGVATAGAVAPTTADGVGSAAGSATASAVSADDVIGRSGRFLRGRYRVVGDPEPDGPITHDVRDIPAPTDLAAMQAELVALRREVREAKSKAEAAMLREEIKTLRALIRRLEDEEDEIAALVLALA